MSLNADPFMVYEELENFNIRKWSKYANRKAMPKVSSSNKTNTSNKKR